MPENDVLNVSEEPKAEKENGAHKRVCSRQNIDGSVSWIV